MLNFIIFCQCPHPKHLIPGEGFTHKTGHIVTISSPGLDKLENTVCLSTQCPEWSYGTRALMRKLAGRKLI